MWARSTRCPPPSGAAASTPTARCPASGPTTSASSPHFGPQPGADVADWPLDYDELEPYYAEVERAIGVAGTDGANPFAAPRSGPFPMPSGAPMFGATRSAAAAERLGYHPYPGTDRRQQRPLRRRGRPATTAASAPSSAVPIHAKGDPDRHAAAGHGHRAGRAAGRDLRVPDPHRGPPGHRRRPGRARRQPSASWPPATWSSPPAPSRRRASCCCPDLEHPLHRPVPDDPLPDHRRRVACRSGPTPSGAGRSPTSTTT